MKRTFVAALPLHLAACATVSAPLPIAAIDSASFEMRTWGNLVHRWTVDEAGRVEHVRDETPFGGKIAPGYQLRRTVLTGVQRSALAAALGRVENERARAQSCITPVTDGPYGKIDWSVGGRLVAFDWNSNCLKGRDADLSAAISVADAIVDDAAMSTPLLKTLPEVGGGKGS